MNEIATKEDLANLISQNKANNWESLSNVQRAVAIKYVENYDIKEVSDFLGLSRDSIRKHLRNPLVASYVQHLQEMQHTTGIVKKDFINQHYFTLLDYAMGREEYRTALPNGEIALVRKVSMPDAISILREMGRSIGYTAEDSNQKKAPVSVTINLSGIFPDNGVTIDGSVVGG